MKIEIPEKPTKVKIPEVKPPKDSVILTDKYYIIQEPVAKWYMTDEPMGKTPYLYKADSFNSKELADKWLLKNGYNPNDYKVIEVEMTLRYV